MSLFQSICADYFGDELPLPYPAVKIMEQNKKKKKMDSTDAAVADKILKKGESENRALTFAPDFDGLFHCETIEQKEEKKKKKKADSTAAKTLDFGAAIDNVVVGDSRKNSSKDRGLDYAPAFDGLFPLEMFVSR